MVRDHAAALEEKRGGGKVCPPLAKQELAAGTQFWSPTDMAVDGIPKDDIALSNAIFAVRLEKQRRPPPRDVWLITDIIDTSCVGSNRPL